MDCSLPALVASHSQMVSLVSDGEGKGAGGSGNFFYFFTYIKLKFCVLLKKKKKGRDKRIQEVQEKVMHNLRLKLRKSYCYGLMSQDENLDPDLRSLISGG